MNRRQMIVSVAASATLAASGGPVLARQQSGVSMPQPPVARRDPHSITQLGRTRTDNYFWMKDDNWQAVMRDPSVLRADIREHLDAENTYSRAMLASTEELQNTLFEEMKGRIKEDDSSVPSPDGDWEYYTRYQIGAQHPLHARRPRGREDGEQILIDVDALAQPHDYYDVGGAEHSADHTLYAWAEDAQGSEYYVIRVKDLATGEVLPGSVESSTGGFTFSPDGQWLSWIAPSEGVLNVWVAPAAAPGEARVLTRETVRPIRQHFWAPDSALVMFINDRGGDEDFLLYGVAPTGGDVRNFTPFPKTRALLVASSTRVTDRILVGLNNRDPRWHDVHSLDLASGKLSLVMQNDGYTGFVADEDLALRLAIRPNAEGGQDYFRMENGKVAETPFLSHGLDDSQTT
ncbi:MAG: hypothetical protein ACK4Y4_10860, partial [Brevundimonas sp.]